MSFPKYTVLNTRTEKQSKHYTFNAAMKAAQKHPADEVVIHEKALDAEVVYNSSGQQMDDDGHFR